MTVQQQEIEMYTKESELSCSQQEILFRQMNQLIQYQK